MSETTDQEALPAPSCDAVAVLVSQALRNLESQRDGLRQIRADVATTEADWSSIERTALTLGRRRRTLEAPLPPLPEPRGAAATRNWLQQRLAQGTRTRAWIERLPAFLALLRPVEPLTAFGDTHAMPATDEAALEALRNDVRQAIVRQDVPTMDRLLGQLQQALTHAGQRRTDLLRVADSRAAAVAAAVVALGTPDAHDAPAVSQWLARAQREASALGRSIRAWDLHAAREAEVALNTLVDGVAAIRGQLEAERARVDDEAVTREASRRAGAARLADLRQQAAESSGLWGTLAAGWPVIAVLGVGGAVAGLVMVALVIGTGSSATWYGAAGLASPLVLGSLGGGVGLVVGAARINGTRASATTEADRLERDVERWAKEAGLAQTKAAQIERVLGWFTLSV